MSNLRWNSPSSSTEVIYSGGALDNNEYKKYGF